MTARIALHATAYDSGPSGARARAVGLAAAWLDLGCHVTVLLPRDLDFRALVADELGGTPPRERWREVPTGLDPARRVARALLSARRLEELVPAGTDLFVTDSHPVLARVPTAVTVHDFRDWHGRSCGARAGMAPLVRARLPRLARRARCVVVPSRAMAEEARAFLGVPEGRVVVAPNAPGRRWREAAAPVGSGRHLLLVGAGDPRKDLRTAVAAVRLAGPDTLPLLVAGRRTRSVEATLRNAADLERCGRLRFVETPSEAALVELVADAAAVLHPSRYEGFGLPVIEACAVGVPVLAGRCAAVEEVSGGLARLLPPGDAEVWAAALTAASGWGRGRCAHAAERREHARSFRWKDSAAAILRAVS